MTDKPSMNVAKAASGGRSKLIGRSKPKAHNVRISLSDRPLPARRGAVASARAISRVTITTYVFTSIGQPASIAAAPASQ